MTREANSTRARRFFERVAYPLYQRHQADGAAEELLWASVTALNHIRDYFGEQPPGNPDIDSLRQIANAFKHAKPDRRNQVPRVEPDTLNSDIWLVPDLWAEPNIFSVWTIEIDGVPCSIEPVLKLVVDFWTQELNVADG